MVGRVSRKATALAAIRSWSAGAVDGKTRWETSVGSMRTAVSEAEQRRLDLEMPATGEGKAR